MADRGWRGEGVSIWRRGCLTAARRTQRGEKSGVRSVRCERCVAVREKEKKVSHGGTATTAKGGNCKTSLCAVSVVSL